MLVLRKASTEIVEEQNCHNENMVPLEQALNESLISDWHFTLNANINENLLNHVLI